MAIRTGMEKAMDAAWRRFGSRHWRLFVGASIARRVLPLAAGAVALGLAASAAAWTLRHAHAPTMPAPHLDFAWTPALITLGVILAVAGAAFAAWRFLDPFAALTRPRLAGVVLVALAAAAAIGVWRT